MSTAAADATADFQVRQLIPQPVSGTVLTSGGLPVAGVQITLTPPGGGTPEITTTDALGHYLFDDNAEADGYTVALEQLIRKTQPYSKRIAHKGIWVEPKLLAEIEYRAKSAEGKVRHPFFKGLREDL